MPFARLLVRKEDASPLLKRLSADLRCEKDIGITQVHNDVIYKSDTEQLVLMIDAADCVPYILIKSSSFYLQTFYSFYKSL